MRLIDGDALLDKYKGNLLTAHTDYAEGVRDVIKDIKEASTIDAVEVVHGKWIWGNEKKSWHKCSVCGGQAYSYYDELADNVEELFDYCPNCGARMKGADDE